MSATQYPVEPQQPVAAASSVQHPQQPVYPVPGFNQQQPGYGYNQQQYPVGYMPPPQMTGGYSSKQQKKMQKEQEKKQKKQKQYDPNSAWHAHYYQQLAQTQVVFLQELFAKVDTSGRGELTAVDLQSAHWGSAQNIQFDESTCKTLVNVFDSTRSRTLSFYEFASLARFIEHLESAFRSADLDVNGTLEPAELGRALALAGIAIDDVSVRPLIKRYQSDQQFSVTFATFVGIASRYAHYTAVFTKNDVKQKGFISVSLPDFLKMVSQCNACDI
jgi:Ca2+-binding EF-hand superfamily protein